jgi:hypothetical protein
MKRFLLASLLALPLSLAAPGKASAGFDLSFGGSFYFNMSCSGCGCGRCGGRGSPSCGYGDSYYGWGDNVYSTGETVAPPVAKPKADAQKTSYDSYYPAYGYQPVGYYQPQPYQAPSYWYGR